MFEQLKFVSREECSRAQEYNFSEIKDPNGNNHTRLGKPKHTQYLVTS